MRDSHEQFLEDFHDGNCPVCGEPFEDFKEYYPTSEASFRGKINYCVRGSLRSNGPDPTLEVYQHE